MTPDKILIEALEKIVELCILGSHPIISDIEDLARGTLAQYSQHSGQQPVNTKDQFLQDLFGLSLNAPNTTPMDKGECMMAMDRWFEYASQYREGQQSAGVWQLCPKCNGQGSVAKPPGVPGDVHGWASSETSYVCDVCEGKKLISQPFPEL